MNYGKLALGDFFHALDHLDSFHGLLDDGLDCLGRLGRDFFGGCYGLFHRRLYSGLLGCGLLNGFSRDGLDGDNSGNLRCRKRLFGSNGIGKGGQSFVFLPVLLNHVAGNKMLQLFIGSEAKHLLTTASGIALLEAVVNHVKKLFEFEGSSLLGENCDQLFGD